MVKMFSRFPMLRSLSLDAAFYTDADSHLFDAVNDNVWTDAVIDDVFGSFPSIQAFRLRTYDSLPSRAVCKLAAHSPRLIWCSMPTKLSIAALQQGLYGSIRCIAVAGLDTTGLANEQ